MLNSEPRLKDWDSETKYNPFSNKRMFGFSIGTLILSMMWSIRGMIQLYAQKGLKLSILTVFIIVAIYAVWDAVNDPLTGYLLDRSKKFTSKYGKRFPFIVIGFIGSLAILVLLYLPITTSPIFAIIWLLCFLIAWDQFQTVCELSLSGLTVDIFRDKHQRVKYGTYTSILDAIGSIVRGTVIPITLGMFGGISQPWAYFAMAVVLCLFLGVILIPHLISAREPEEMIQLRSKLDQEGKSSTPFLKMLGRIFKDKNWISFVIAYLAYVVYITCITIGIYYYVVDGLGLPVESVVIFNLAFLLINFISIPFWMRIVKKIGARKSYFYAMMWSAIGSPLFLFFGWEFLIAVLIGMLGGVGNAGIAVSFNSVYSETIDNAAVQSGKREEASYLGILRFFTATGLVWQVLIFMIVSYITGYNPNIEYDYSKGIVPSQIARIGLNMQISVIPAAIFLIAGLIFLKFNTITKEVALENKKKLIEMGL